VAAIPTATTPVKNLGVPRRRRLGENLRGTDEQASDVLGRSVKLRIRWVGFLLTILACD